MEIRPVIYTTNAIESVNRSLRKVTKTKAVFPSEDRSKISAYKFPSGINLSKAATEQRLSASIQGRP